jgi:hypothetical protein
LLDLYHRGAGRSFDDALALEREAFQGWMKSRAGS